VVSRVDISFYGFTVILDQLLQLNVLEHDLSKIN
jgi:hypothetical protein